MSLKMQHAEELAVLTAAATQAAHDYDQKVEALQDQYRKELAELTEEVHALARKDEQEVSGYCQVLCSCTV